MRGATIVSRRSVVDLPDVLISQIAAGEVVERPASVVKELVENSLDAEARRVDVSLVSGGRAVIEVNDDGLGMDEADAVHCFRRHATSKLGSFEELERIGTLGFRGEALAAIAAVSKVVLVTASEPGVGTRVEMAGGELVTTVPTSAPRGTRISVRSLFYNVPARRSFLKTPATELRRCLEVLHGYALANPEVGFFVTHEERERLSAAAVVASGGTVDEATVATAAGRRSLRLERIAQIFGAELASHLEPLAGASGVEGFVGDASTVRNRRSFIFVNGRLVRDRALLGVFYRAVRDEWKSDRFPSLFLFLDVAPEQVDVNVHPQKAEVRFRDPGQIGAVVRALRDALARARGEGSAPLRGLGDDVSLPALGWAEGRAPAAGAGGLRAESRPVEGKTGDDWVAEPSRLPQVVGTVAPATRVPLSGPRGVRETARLLGQYKGSLVLLESDEGLLLIDQHAAHERVLYERFKSAIERGRVEQQLLLEPAIVTVDEEGGELLEGLTVDLESMGFGLTVLSVGSVGLSATPAGIRIEQAQRLVVRLAERLAASSGSDEARVAQLRERLAEVVLDDLAATQACRGAIRIHHPLTQAEMEKLIEDLFACEQPFSCPHGRSTILRMGDAELERRFGRR